MELHDQVIAPSLHAHTANRALDAAHNRLRGKDASGTMTGRARLRHVLKMALPDPLARHLDKAEVTDGKGLGPRAVATEMGPQLLEHLVAIRLRLHIDEVADDDATDVAQAELSRDLARGLDVGLEDRLLRVALSGVPTRVDVDRDERFGWLDDEVATRGQVTPPLEQIADLVLEIGRASCRERV